MRERLPILAVVFILAAAIPTHLRAQSPEFNVTILGANTSASAINDAGEIGGNSGSNSVEWSSDTSSPVTLYGGQGCTITGINDSGDITGYSGVNAAVWSGTNQAVLQSPSNSAGADYAQGISDSGEIAGFSFVTGGTDAVVWSGSSAAPTELQALGTMSHAFAINNSGEIAGDSLSGPLDSGTIEAVIWTSANAAPTILGYPEAGIGSQWASALAINNEGDSVGFAYHVGYEIPMEWNGATPTAINIGAIGGEAGGAAVAINDSGEVVGWGGGGAAFLYVNGSVYNLDNLIPSGSGLSIEYATGINDQGDITGWGMENEQEVGFELTPVPEPSSRAMFALGFAALFGALHAKRIRTRRA
jgi:probable HAF family extracellular repeat protein